MKQLIRSALEYLGILKVIIDIKNDEIRIIEAFKFLAYFRIISIKSEVIYDRDRLSFILERFLEKNTTHKIRRIYLTLSSTSIIPLFFSFPGIPKEKIESAILWEIERNIPLPLEEAYYTYKIVSKVSEEGKNVWNVIAVVAKKEEVDRYIDIFRNLNIIVEEVSYLPINILSALQISASENAIGYIYICEHTIELYIVLHKKIINFTHLIGEFDENTPITVKNIVDYFAGFIKKRIAFLERVIVICDNEKIRQEIVDSIFDSISIFTLPASQEDFIGIFRRMEAGLSIYDLVGFAYKNYIKLEISSKSVKNLHFQDVAIRAFIVAFILFDIFSVAFFPAILIANDEYNLITRAKDTPIDQIQDSRTLEMAEKLAMIEKIDQYKKREENLIRKIQEIKSAGIDSSRLKIMLMEVCRIIPMDVWVSKIEVTNHIGQMQGYSLTSDGLENFVVYLINSRVIKDVVLEKATVQKIRARSIFRFTIKFGV